MKISKKKAAALCFTILLVTKCKLAKTRSKRRFGVRPMNLFRKKLGHYHNLIKRMRTVEQDEEQFFKYTRMPIDLYNHLLSIVKNDLTKEKHNALPADCRLLMTLHYLAEGCSMQEIAWNFYVGKTTVHKVIKETCDVIWSRLSPVYLKSPERSDFIEISNGFFKRWNLPHCVGALDGKHIQIQCPKYSGSVYFNYKKSFSLNLMATCDAFYKFSMVDIGSVGSNHDSSVFKNSPFGIGLLNQLKHIVDIPPPSDIPQTNIKMPYFLVADAAFPLHLNIMRPYPGQYLDVTKNVFNYRLSRARRVIENTFGILVQRWRILRRAIIADISTCESITKATVVLHNFVQLSEKDIPEEQRRYCPTGYVDREDNDGNIILGQWRTEASLLRSVNRIGSNNSTRNVRRNRDILASYFMSSAGCVPWQLDYVTRGSGLI